MDKTLLGLRPEVRLKIEAEYKCITDLIRIARLVADSPPRSAQSVRLISKLKEKIEALDSK